MHRTQKTLAITACLSALALAGAAGAEPSLHLAVSGASTIAAQIAEREAVLSERRAKLGALEAELAALPAATAVLERSLRDDVRALYRLRRGGLLPAIGGIEALLGHAARVAHLERMAQRTLSELGTLRTRAAQLREEAGALAGEVKGLEGTLAALTQQQAAEEQAAAEALERALHDREEPSALRMAYGLSLLGPGPDKSGSFFGQRGQLALPLANASDIRDAPGYEGTGGLLVLSGQPGSSVRAVASGRVASVTQRDGAVQVVIEHGGQYRTTYGGLRTADVQRGDDVSKSARLGSAGEAPVTFELRHGSKRQDARTWLGL